MGCGHGLAMIVIVPGRAGARGQGGRIDAHRVVAQEEVVEPVVAVGVRGGGDGLGRDAVTIQVTGQGHGDPGKPLLVRILDAVTVAVVPDQVADGAGTGVAEIDPVHVLARGQGVGGLVVGQVGGAVQVIGRGRAAGQGGGIDQHRVVSGRQVVKGVVAVCVRDHGLAVLVDPVTVDIGGDAHADPGKAVFIRVLDTVTIPVVPDPVADGTGTGVAEILVQVACAGGQVHGGGVVQGPVRITACDHGHGQGGGVHVHRVVATQQVAKAVGTIGGRDRAGAVVDAAVTVDIPSQGHGDPADAGMGPLVLGAVAVGVIPDEVTDGAGAAQAEIDIVPVLVRGQGKGGAVVGSRGAGILVIGCLGATGRGDGDHEVTGRQVVETVDTGPVRGRGGRILEYPVAVDVRTQADAEAADAVFTGILDTVGIDVKPDGVSHRVLSRVAEIHVGALLAGGKADAPRRVVQGRAAVLVQVIGLVVAGGLQVKGAAAGAVIVDTDRVVGKGGQVVEQVGAVGVGGHGAGELGRAVVVHVCGDGDVDPGDAHVAAGEVAGVVGVKEDRVAQGCVGHHGERGCIRILVAVHG